MTSNKKVKITSIERITVEKKLAEEIDELTNELQKQNSPSRTFWSGVIRGLGTAIGATLLFGIMITVLSLLVKGTENTIIQKIADWIMLDSYSR